jgi:hypothetical protein
MATTFKTNPVSLSELLRDCARGDIQLPDFQRSWVWDDERIQNLIASVSQAFPVGALMALRTGGDVHFHPRPVQGVSSDEVGRPSSLLLDGQQRMTSLYQALMRQEVIRTRNTKGLAVNRFYYIDMRKALDPDCAREDAIVAVGEDKTVKGAFGKVAVDVSTQDAEFEQLLFPLNRVFDKAKWQTGFWKYWMRRDQFDAMEALWQAFDDRVIANFEGYLVPVIELGSGTSREAICLVFEKVNTGGKALDAFELVTAMYAADGFRLRDDWSAREKRLHQYPVLKSIGAIDFLQTISLLHSAEVRAQRAAAGDGELPAISATRASLLRLPLHSYERHADRVEQGFVLAAKFLRRQRIYRVLDLPYRSQLVPLAATLADAPDILEHATRFDRLSRWYWCGVFGELYGGATETRMARDYAEVPRWTVGEGAEPTTVTDASFRSDRLASMTSRLSAAYKGVNARLMDVGALDFRSGQPFEQSTFFDESVDIHHIFPRAWCLKQGIAPGVFNSIVNKTPLSAKTNRILGGTAPSTYLSRLEKGGTLAPPIPSGDLDGYLHSHGIDAGTLRADDFARFMQARREALIALIERAMGKSVYRDTTEEVGTALDDGEAEALDLESLDA